MLYFLWPYAKHSSSLFHEDLMLSFNSMNFLLRITCLNFIGCVNKNLGFWMNKGGGVYEEKEN